MSGSHSALSFTENHRGGFDSKMLEQVINRWSLAILVTYLPLALEEALCVDACFSLGLSGFIRGSTAA